MAICLYDEHDRQARLLAHQEYIVAPLFADLSQKALLRGFRHAEVSEINASAESQQWAPELFCWAGGLWVKL